MKKKITFEKKILCNKSCNLALSKIHQHAESQYKAYVSQCIHSGGVSDHTAPESDSQKRWISLLLSR